MVTELKYVVWGTKRGAQTFFHSNNFDVKGEEIKNTLKDVRKYYKPNMTTAENYYAIEYTSQYLVYTIYYFLYDWANRDGFLAITVYVPSSQQLQDPVKNLKSIFYEYKDNYIGANHRIKELTERKEIFDDIISSFLIVPSPQIIKPSPQNRKYGVEYFNSDLELADFLNDPIRKEYCDYQEVMFLPQSLKGDYKTLVPLNGKAKRIFDLSIVIAGHKGQLPSEGLNVSFDIYNLQNTCKISKLRYADEVTVNFKKDGYKPFVSKYKVADLVESDSYNGKINTIALKITPQPEKRTFRLNVSSSNGGGLKNVKLVRSGRSTETQSPIVVRDIVLLENEKITISSEGFKEHQITLNSETNLSIILKPDVKNGKDDGDVESSDKSTNLRKWLFGGMLAIFILLVAAIGLKYLNSTPQEKKVIPRNDNETQSIVRGTNKKVDKIGDDTTLVTPILQDKIKKQKDIKIPLEEIEKTRKKTKTSDNQKRLDAIIDFANKTNFDKKQIASYILEIKAYSRLELDYSNLKDYKGKPYASKDAYSKLVKRLEGMKEIAKADGEKITLGKFEMLDDFPLSQGQNKYIAKLKDK